MKSFAEQLSDLAKAGYRVAEAQAKVAHDAILLALYKSGFKKNCTVKGGDVAGGAVGGSADGRLAEDGSLHLASGKQNLRARGAKWPSARQPTADMAPAAGDRPHQEQAEGIFEPQRGEL